MLGKLLWRLAVARFVGEWLLASGLFDVAVTCRKCRFRGRPQATVQDLRLSSSWGWVQLVRRVDQTAVDWSLVEGTAEARYSCPGWKQMEVPTCRNCGHQPVASVLGLRWSSLVRGPGTAPAAAPESDEAPPPAPPVS